MFQDFNFHKANVYENVIDMFEIFEWSVWKSLATDINLIKLHILQSFYSGLIPSDFQTQVNK